MIEKIKEKRYFFPLLTILFIVQSYFYFQHIINNYKLMNEYRYINEITILKDQNVSNQEYINQNLLFKPNLKEAYTSTKNIFFNDKKGTGLSFNNFPDYLVMAKYQANSYKYLFNKSKKLHFSNIKYSKNLNLLYTDYIFNNNNNNNNKLYIQGNKILPYFATYPMFQAKTIDKLRQKMDFIYKNTYEQDMQIFDRYYWEENSFVLAPITEMELHRPKKEIFSQYGYLNVVLVAKIMNMYGGFSINNYEKAKKTINLLYYVVYIICILLLFKDNILRLGLIVIFGIAFFGDGYYAFSYAPTVTNSRHLLDIFIIPFLYLYMNKRNFFFLAIASILSVLSIFIAKGFGQFIFLSIIGTLLIPLVVDYLKTKNINKRNAFLLIITIIFGLLAIKLYPMMPNPSVKYFLDGFYSFPFRSNIIFFLVLLVILLQWIFLVTLYEKLLSIKYLYVYIFTLFYTQFLYTYFIWHGTINDIVVYSYLYILPFAIVYNLFNFKYKRVFSFILLIVFLVVYIKLLNTFVQGEENYNNVFKTHETYKWNLKRAGGIITTYSFDKFGNSIKLIDKYAQSKRIYMISKYDNMLEILSKHYSGFPFFELRSSIVTKNDFNMIKNQINRHAKILFVDNDIDRDYKKEMARMAFFDLEPFWRNESLKQRIPKLNDLKKLWSEVKNNYKLIKKGKLISVYKRKN